MLSNVCPHVDEVVIVDGSPQGASTDSTEEIATGFDKVVYHKGTYQTDDGGWDSAAQQTMGLELLTGDLVVLMSTDMLYNDFGIFRRILEEDHDSLLFFCSIAEFWEDTTRLRMYTQSGNNMLNIPSYLINVFGLDMSLTPYYNAQGVLVIDDIVPERRTLIPELFRYHLGWIRSFSEQVSKHVRNVKSNRWGEQGQKLLEEGPGALEQWAIQHVLSYPQVPSVAFKGQLPEEMDAFMGMKYNTGYEDVVSEYEKKYNKSVFGTWG